MGKSFILFLFLFVLCFPNNGRCNEQQTLMEYERISQSILLDPVEAKLEILEFVQEANLDNDSFKLGLSYIVLAKLELIQGNYLDAANSIQFAHDIFVATDRQNLIGTSLNVAAGIAMSVGDYEKAHYFDNRALDIYINLSDTTKIAYCYLRMSSSITELGDTEKGKSYLEKSRKIYEENQDTLNMINSYLLYANLFLKESNFSEANKFAHKARRSAEISGNFLNLYASNLMLGRVSKLNNSLDSSRIYFLAALKHAETIDNQFIYKEIYTELSAVYEELDSSMQALHFFKLKDEVEAKSEDNNVNEYLDSVTLNGSKEGKSPTEDKLNSSDSSIWLKLMLFTLMVLTILSFIYFKRKRDKTNRVDSELNQEPDDQDINLTAQLKLIEKEEMLRNVTKQLASILEKTDTENRDKIVRIEKQLNAESGIINWTMVEAAVERIGLVYYQKLNAKHPDLTQNERNLCTLIILNLDTMEMSDITKKSIRSIQIARHRLKKKLKLEKHEQLYNYLINLI